LLGYDLAMDDADGFDEDVDSQLILNKKQ